LRGAVGDDGAIIFRSEAGFEGRGLDVAMTFVDDENDEQDDCECGSGKTDLEIREVDIRHIHCDSPVRESPQRLRAEGEGFLGRAYANDHVR